MMDWFYFLWQASQNGNYNASCSYYHLFWRWCLVIRCGGGHINIRNSIKNFSATLVAGRAIRLCLSFQSLWPLLQVRLHLTYVKEGP